MFKFSQKSLKNLEGVDNQLKLLANEVLKISPIDFSIIDGFRDRVKQNELFTAGKSKCDGYKTLSKHQLGQAIDILPCKEKYNYSRDIFILVGLFIAVAKQLNIEIKTGALWSYNTTLDNQFIDAYHIELI